MKKTITSITDIMEAYLEDCIPGDSLSFDDYGDEGYKEGRERIPPPSRMNLVDYNLNSPLIADRVDGFVSFCKRWADPTHASERNWDMERKKFKDHGIDFDTLKGSQTYHKWLFDLKSRPIETRRIEKILAKTDEDARQTFEVIRAFHQRWINQAPAWKGRQEMDKMTLKYGEIFVRFYLMTLMINCSSEDEAKELWNLVGCTMTWSPEAHATFIWDLKDWGRIVIGQGCLVFRRGGQYLDRSMVLMAKDVFGGRFQTLMHLQYKEDPEYNPELLKTMIDIFDEGDLLLRKYGSSAYKVIKMVEPVSLEKLHQLSAESKPMVPPFVKFRNHLRVSTRELEAVYPGAGEFLTMIHDQEEVEPLITAYGSFRLWGHPFIDYLSGLAALYENVTAPKEIDEEYANQLASDLAFKVIKNQFFGKKKWVVDGESLPDENIMKSHILNLTWPNSQEIFEFGDNWHRLPLQACFEIPDFITLSNLYSDKSHSPDLSEVIQEILKHQKGGTIKSYSVLQSLKDRPAQNWPEFVRKVNDVGLTVEELVIGLKAKEREIKDIGRFFALMSWALREYFVITEYLIKEFYIKLFKGLTMADDLNTVIEKMMQSTDSQGNIEVGEFENLTISNHIDYSKWNNHQRAKGNDPVFRVMGQFFGFPNLFTRTHEFFEKSLIYYKDRPDLMTVVDGKVVNKTDKIVCWQGQAGGLEGLRQKGWSIVGLLCLARQSKVRNTKVKFLAQGDNQIISTFFRVSATRSDEEKAEAYATCVRNNERILESVRLGAKKLGLIINEDETLQSATLTVYGKVILYRGAFKSLTEKRFSRVLCTTNDQLPSLSSVAATVVTNCLTVANYSDDSLNPMKQYNWLGNFARTMLELHDPAIRKSGSAITKTFSKLMYYRYIVNFLYKDPSLGGVGGMSLLRFLVRQFPDPVSESLTFWKIVYQGTDNELLKQICIENGNPQLAAFQFKHFEKLLENPQGLNLPRGVAPVTVLQNCVRKMMLKDSQKMQNRIIGDALVSLNKELNGFNLYLFNIQPCFPRFLSEFRAATYYGMVLNLLSLFENSRTFRRILVENQSTVLDEVTVKAELSSYKMLSRYHNNSVPLIWDCSASQADYLRTKSWNRKIYGATIPHPAEMFQDPSIGNNNCQGCQEEGLRKDHVVVVVPYVYRVPVESRGDYKPYLGSKTSENTSMLSPWEKTTNLPLITRSALLRVGITWFIEANSNLAEAIKRNLDSLTGEDSGRLTAGYRRTGSALHRFACSRQSTGGFAAISPNLLTFMIVTTDTLRQTSQQNYDFLYQALILYAQVSAAVAHRFSDAGCTYHFHLACLDCLREIDDIQLNATSVYPFQDVSKILEHWKPPGTAWFQQKSIVEIPLGDWSTLFSTEQSFQIGRISGFHLADQTQVFKHEAVELFPNVIARNLDVRHWVEGFVEGVIRACALFLTHKRSVQMGRSCRIELMGSYQRLVKRLSQNVELLALLGQERMYVELSRGSHYVPAEFPLQLTSIHETFLSYAYRLAGRVIWSDSLTGWTRFPDLWIFSDFLSLDIAGPYQLSTRAMENIFSANRPDRRMTREQVRSIARTDTELRGLDFPEMQARIMFLSGHVYSTPSEMKHACRDIVLPEGNEFDEEEVEFGQEHTGYILVTTPEFIREQQDSKDYEVPRKSNPTLSGLRLSKISTGGHIKLLSILRGLGIHAQDFIVGGDGSGGFTACLLRAFPSARGIFNTILEGHGVILKGTTPSPPSAINCQTRRIKQRCVNLTSCWSNPSDLEAYTTWEYWLDLIREHNLHIDLLVFDMEVLKKSDNKIVTNLKRFLRESNIVNRVTIVYKTYFGAIMNGTSTILDEVGPIFRDIKLVQTQYTGSSSSEVYVIMRGQQFSVLGERYLNREDLWQKRDGILIFKSSEEEFLRANQCFNLSTLSGVPSRFIPNLQEQLYYMFSSLDVDATMCAHYAQLFSGHHGDSVKERFIAVLVRIGIEKVNQNRNGLGELTVPSDAWLLRYITFQLALFLWISLKTRDSSLYKRVDDILQKGLIFSWKTTEHQVRWSFMEFLGKNKKLRMDSNLGQISKILSLLTQLNCAQGYPINWNTVRVHYSEFRVPYSDQFIFSNTGCLHFLSSRFEAREVGIPDVVGGVDYEEDDEFDI
uniref:Replicase n=1 Tax=Corixo rhabdovirus 2 TaxID=3078403 RepID=A0AB38Z1Q4_9RHAB